MASFVYDLLWGQDLAAQITNKVTEAVQAVRMVRPLIPIAFGQMAYVKTVPDTTVIPVAAAAGAPAAVETDPTGTLAPIRFSRSFVVRREQFGDIETISQLAINAGYDLATDEDALLLFGAFAPFFGWAATDESGTLVNQPSLLPALLPFVLGAVDASILAAITALRVNRHFGPFCVVFLSAATVVLERDVFYLNRL